LGALVARHFGVEHSTQASFPGGAARVADSTAWVFADDDVVRSLGTSLAWARQHHVGELHLVVERDAGLLARRAAQFAEPPHVWWLQGMQLHPAEPEAAPSPAQPPDAPDLTRLLVDAGLDVVVEHGHLAGELRGLEVARITTGGLEVGVGEADRDLTAMVHGELSPEDALHRVVGIVQDKRRPGAPRHPLNQLVPERWLRWSVRRDPASVDLTAVGPAPLPRPRRGMRERDIAAATADGSVIVFSVGIDLDLVPAAAEARAAIDPAAHLVLVVPERDDHPVTHALADKLQARAEIRTVAGDWRL
jgi:hypothetical protein